MALLKSLTKGATSRQVILHIVDDPAGTPETGVTYATSGIDLWYRREGAAIVSITEVTLAALTTAWASGGFKELDHGAYRLDVPDAAFASGVSEVEIGGTITGMIVYGGTVQLNDFDLESAAVAATTLVDNIMSETALQRTDIATLSTQLEFTLTDGSGDDDAYNGAKIMIIDAATLTQRAVGWISDYVGSTKTVTLESDPGIFTIAAGDDVVIFPVEKQLETIATLDEIIAGLADEVRYATAQAGSATTITLDTGANATDNFYNGTLIIILSGTGATDPLQIRAITGYVGSTRVATVATWTVNPDVTSGFLLLGLN